MKSEKGGGIFTKVLNFFSGRKTARRKAMVPANLSEEQKEKKKQLEKKIFKTKKNKANLSKLQTRIAIPKQSQYESMKEEALASRSKFQKFFNRFYKPQNQPTPTQLEKMPIEGLGPAFKNTRFNLNRRKAKIPNSELNNAPEKPGEAFRMINGQRVELAGQATIIYVNAPLLYAMWKREAPRNKLEEIPDADYQRFVEAIRSINVDNLDEGIRRVFHLEGGLEELEEWRIQHEEGAGWPSNPNTMDFEYYFGDGTSIEKRLVKIPGSASARRLINDMSASKEELLDRVESDLTTCPSPLDTNDKPAYRNASGRFQAPRYMPLSTLKSNGCILLVNSEENLTQMIEMGNYSKNWIILKPTYMHFSGQMPMMAKYFKSARYIQKAFDNWGILGIDPALLELFQLKYPELAMKISTYIISTKDFAYQERKLKPFENFLVLDKSIFPEEIGYTALNPFHSSSNFHAYLERAEEQDKLYGMSPYMAYIMKKIALPFWKRVFLSPGMEENLRIYQTLSRPEQITVDYLQHLRFKDTLLASDYNFEVARDTYKDAIGEGDLTQGVIKKLVDLYMFDFRKHSDELEQYQKSVIRPYEREWPVILTHKQNIQEILMKFKRPVPIRRPPNKNNNNNYSPAVPFNTAPTTVAPPRSSLFEPAPPRKSVATATGAFNKAFMRTNKSRPNVTRRVRELNAWLANHETQHQAVLNKYGNLSKLQPKVNFVTRKLKYLRGNRSKLTKEEKELLDGYVLAKQYALAQGERRAKSRGAE
jgi:hypothetical protein